MDLQDLDKKLSTILEHINNKEGDSYQSEKTDELNTALAVASKEFSHIVVNRQNPYLASGYADLDQIMRHIRPILGKNGLHISQQKKLWDGSTLLVTRVWHSSGQWIESRVMVIPTKNTLSSYGSRLNVMKRFEVMDILGITVSEDPFDDDGEQDMDEKREQVQSGGKIKDLYNKRYESYDVITNEQYSELMSELDDYEELAQQIMDDLSLKSFRELSKSRFPATIKRIRKLKKNMTG